MGNVFLFGCKDCNMYIFNLCVTTAKFCNMVEKKHGEI